MREEEEKEGKGGHTPRQNGRWQRHIVLEGLGLVVAAAHRVGSRKDGRARVERGLGCEKRVWGLGLQGADDVAELADVARPVECGLRGERGVQDPGFLDLGLQGGGDGRR